MQRFSQINKPNVSRLDSCIASTVKYRIKMAVIFMNTRLNGIAHLRWYVISLIPKLFVQLPLDEISMLAFTLFFRYLKAGINKWICHFTCEKSRIIETKSSSKAVKNSNSSQMKRVIQKSSLISAYEYAMNGGTLMIITLLVCLMIM